MKFTNGVRGVYEGSSSAAVGLNDWMKEYIRVDCEFGTAQQALMAECNICR